MSYLTQGEASLLADVITGLEGEGFAFNPLTTSLPVYLATCLGDATAYRTKSVAQMLAELNSEFGGDTVSHLSTSVAALLSTLNATLVGGGGGGFEWMPEDALAGGNFVTEEYWLNGSECTLGDLLGGDHFDPIPNMGETGMFLTRDSGNAFANPNIPIFSAALIALMANSNITIMARMKATLDNVAVVFCLADNLDYNLTNSQIQIYRAEADNSAKLEDWVDVDVQLDANSYPQNQFVTIGATLYRPLGGGAYIASHSIDGALDENDQISAPPTWVTGALGFSENIFDPSGTSDADSIIEWFAILPAKTGAELAALTA
jgi:hypothetical protein